jgi:hypothetical protein
VTTRVEAEAAYENALKMLQEVTQMYESLRGSIVEPQIAPKLNQIAQSLEQTRTELTIMRAQLNLMAQKKKRRILN